MTHELRKKLPSEIVDIIKLYTGEGCWRNGKYINIHKIPKNDPRYTMLRKRPRIKQLIYDSTEKWSNGVTWFKLDTGKFVVINVGQMKVWNGTQFERGYFWEMHYNQNKNTQRLL